MAYTFETPSLGYPPVATAITAGTGITQGATTVYPATALGRVPGANLGTIVRGSDLVYGEGEFIYLLGVAATVVGSWVSYNGGAGAPTYQTALMAVTAGQGVPIAVAMSACLAGQYGWYQIQGNAVAATNGTMTATSKIYTAGSGQATSTQAAGTQILNAVSNSATGTPAAGQAVVMIDRPFLQGQIV